MADDGGMTGDSARWPHLEACLTVLFRELAETVNQDAGTHSVELGVLCRTAFELGIELALRNPEVVGTLSAELSDFRVHYYGPAQSAAYRERILRLVGKVHQLAENN